MIFSKLLLKLANTIIGWSERNPTSRSAEIEQWKATENNHQTPIISLNFNTFKILTSNPRWYNIALEQVTFLNFYSTLINYYSILLEFNIIFPNQFTDATLWTNNNYYFHDKRKKLTIFQATKAVPDLIDEDDQYDLSLMNGFRYSTSVK